MNLVLPKSTVQLIGKVPDDRCHPGLQLDKFSIPGNQKAQKGALDKVCRIAGDSALLTRLCERRQRILASLPGATEFRCATTGPLTLHLSRASALENAGIGLHPLYGFAYLPGSGLKGMARAFAETVWLPTQYATKSAHTLAPCDGGERAKAEAAWRKIEDVFGWAPNPDRRQQIEDPDHPAAVRRENDSDPRSPEIKASSGGIVFHDAWPTSWPPLVVDIVNNHHPDYYQHEDDNHPPGDWENPVPVYFLAVKPGTTFSFVLSKRQADVDDKLLDLARHWLLGALCHLGAGAKTNAGYGAFKPVNDMDASLPAAVDGTWQAATSGTNATRAVFETTLELVTPAFLAGASQYGPAAAEGCDLRPATLRGHLRWWWRTMHAGFLDVKTLRALEAAVWGDTKTGGAVRIVIEPTDKVPQPQPYNKRAKANFTNDQKRGPLGTPNGDPRKTTQGLWYASYGMDEHNRRRYVIEPPASWRLRLIARPTRFYANRADATDPKKHDRKPIAAEQAVNQAMGALWLMCHFGAVGSKARKGFGSLTTAGPNGGTLDTCRQTAKQLRTELGFSNSFHECYAHSSSLHQMLDPVEVVFSWPDVWQVLDQVGFAYQTFAKRHKHRREKMALGLPRRIDQPVQGTFNPRLPVTTSGRHSSPVHIHIVQRDGGWLVRAVAFPVAHLPDLQTSTTFLKEFLEGFRQDLERRAKLKPPPSRRQAPHPQGRRSTAGTGGPSLPGSGERVEAVLLPEKTKKGGWKAKHEATGLSGPIQNSVDVPADKKPGDKLSLIVASANTQQIAFRYPTATDQQRARRRGVEPRGGQPGRRPGDRR